MKKLKDTGVQEINAKSLKGVSGFNKGDIMAPLLVEFYEITKRAMGNERQQNVIIRGYTLEDLAAVGDDNAVLRNVLTVTHLSQWITLLNMD